MTVITSGAAVTPFENVFLAINAVESFRLTTRNTIIFAIQTSVYVGVATFAGLTVEAYFLTARDTTAALGTKQRLVIKEAIAALFADPFLVAFYAVSRAEIFADGTALHKSVQTFAATWAVAIGRMAVFANVNTRVLAVAAQLITLSALVTMLERIETVATQTASITPTPSLAYSRVAVFAKVAVITLFAIGGVQFPIPEIVLPIVPVIVGAIKGMSVSKITIRTKNVRFKYVAVPSTPHRLYLGVCGFRVFRGYRHADQKGDRENKKRREK